MNVLVTGGAGFIGSHIVDALLADGHRVTSLDALHPQVHSTRRLPAYCDRRARYVRGDVRNARILAPLLAKADAVIHDAARVGVGQSMYEMEEYVDANVRGTAVLLELLATKRHRVRKLIVASSMSIYGEGAYRCPKCGPVDLVARDPRDLAKGRFEPRCPRGHVLVAIPTPESKPIRPTSIYASTKRDQEEMCLMVGGAYGIPTVALRYFNVYGPRQALSNPYTGVLAIFGARLLNANPPLLFEDGEQRRDFVHVRDIASANVAALSSSRADGMALNVGSGVARSVASIATDLAAAMGSRLKPTILREFRVGDIRHCYADASAIRRTLRWRPEVRWEAGVEEYVAGLAGKRAVDNVDRAMKELSRQKLRKRSR